MTIRPTHQGTHYYVLDEHTLGYVYDAQPTVFGILASDVHGIPWMQGIVPLSPTSALRNASRDDFARFRVDPTGHIEDGGRGSQ